MKLKVRLPKLDAGGKTVVIINEIDARELGVYPLDRIVLSKGKSRITAIVNITRKFVKHGEIVVYDEVREQLPVKNGDFVCAEPRHELLSKRYIRMKVLGKALGYNEFRAIATDMLHRDLNDLEIASFITALTIHGMTIRENIAMTNVMANLSKKLKFSGTVVDKHSIGGVPGDKTSMLVVPIIASAGLTIPKTSSRAITNAAGTADRAEMLMPVDLGIEKMKKVVKKTGGCIVWGGAIDLAPVDDLFIQIEHPLSMDPMLMPSVLGKKKVVGSKLVVIDIPVGPKAKVRTASELIKMGRNFMAVGKHIGIKVKYIRTDARQPLGYAIGPALEAREALQSIMDFEKAPKDLAGKVVKIAGALLKMSGKGDEKTAIMLWKSGKAGKKLRQIIKAQGGNPDIMPEKIRIGPYSVRISAAKPGKVKKIDNEIIVRIAKAAGAPKAPAAGIMLGKKLGERVKKGEQLMMIYADNKENLKKAVKTARMEKAFDVG